MALQQGEVLRDRYEIRRIIKSGGMGSVYEALDRNLNNPCAVKEMLEIMARGSDAELIRRKFKEEAQMLIRLQHPGIPRVRDFFTDGDICYIVMDLVHGANLELELADCQALTGRPFLPEVLAKDMLQVLDMLVYLHGLDPPVIHRDIKPANLIREFKTSRIRLVDFGLARSADGGNSQTVIGTLGYCPLEQLRGRAETRSDLYALGVTMHQLVTGCVPSVLALEPLDQVAPGLDRRLAAIINKAAAPEAKDRYSSAFEMLRALQAFTGVPEAPGQPFNAVAPARLETAVTPPGPTNPLPAAVPTNQLPASPPPTPLEPPRAAQESRPGWSLPLVGLLIFTCAAFLGLGLWMGRPTPRAEVAATPTPTASESSPTPLALSSSPQAPPSPAPIFAYHPRPHLVNPLHPRVPHPPARPRPTPAQAALQPRFDDGGPQYPQAHQPRPRAAHLAQASPARQVDWPGVKLQMTLPPGFRKLDDKPQERLEAQGPNGLHLSVSTKTWGRKSVDQIREETRRSLGDQVVKDRRGRKTPRWQVHDGGFWQGPQTFWGYRLQETRAFGQAGMLVVLIDPKVDPSRTFSFQFLAPAGSPQLGIAIEAKALAKNLTIGGHNLPWSEWVKAQG